MAIEVAAPDSEANATSISAVLGVRNWGRSFKNFGAEDFSTFESFPLFEHRSPWSASPITKCSRPCATTSVVNRYYDPTTDQFLSIDPDVATTDQPYVFTNDDPLNQIDPLGTAAAGLMDGGSQTLKQDAATFNLILEAQMTNVGGPTDYSPLVSVAELNNKDVLALDLMPNDPKRGKIESDRPRRSTT
jgi:hypothetical protein